MQYLNKFIRQHETYPKTLPTNHKHNKYTIKNPRTYKIIEDRKRKMAEK